MLTGSERRQSELGYKSMDQEKGAGHHVITQLAVHELFQTLAPDGGTIRGMDEKTYFARLDHAQEVSDSVWHHYWGTAHPADFDPSVQKEHSMADPHKSGADNLSADKKFIVDQSYLARGEDIAKLSHLGAAIHALEDSYSEAHVWRGASIFWGDPTAPIVSFNVFDVQLLGDRLGYGHDTPLLNLIEGGTHDARFDRVWLDPKGNVVTGPNKAAVEGAAKFLIGFEKSYQEPLVGGTHGWREFTNVVDSLFRPADTGVKVELSPDPVWKLERDRRLERQEDQRTHPNPAMPEWDPDAHQWRSSLDAYREHPIFLEGPSSTQYAPEQEPRESDQLTGAVANASEDLIADTSEAIASLEGGDPSLSDIAPDIALDSSDVAGGLDSGIDVDPSTSGDADILVDPAIQLDPEMWAQSEATIDPALAVDTALSPESGIQLDPSPSPDPATSVDQGIQHDSAGWVDPAMAVDGGTSAEHAISGDAAMSVDHTAPGVPG